MRKLADIFWRWAAAIVVAAIVLLATAGCATTTAPKAEVRPCDQCKAWVHEHEGVHYAIFTAEDLMACFEEVRKQERGECQ